MFISCTCTLFGAAGLGGDVDGPEGATDDDDGDGAAALSARMKTENIRYGQFAAIIVNRCNINVLCEQNGYYWCRVLDASVQIAQNTQTMKSWRSFS